MKSKVRLLWIKLHTYFACFFLPITFLYLATGILYLFDIEGGVKNKYEYEVALPNGWPTTEADAKQLVSPFINNNQHGRFPPDYYSEPEYISWYGYKQEILLLPTNNEHRAELKVLKHDLWHQFLLIHKGHAGLIFWLFGIMMGLSLFFSFISGLVIAIAVPKFRKPSLIATALGVIVLIILFKIGY